MVGCATATRTRRQASAVDCVRGRLSVLVSRVCVCHQPIPHDARECIVGLRSAAVAPIAPPSVVCRVSDVGARLRLVWAASAEFCFSKFVDEYGHYTALHDFLFLQGGEIFVQLVLQLRLGQSAFGPHEEDGPQRLVVAHDGREIADAHVDVHPCWRQKVEP
jgi:hypothetical protein